MFFEIARLKLTSYIKAIEEYLNVAQPYLGLPVKNRCKRNSSDFYVKKPLPFQTFEQLHSKGSTTLTLESWEWYWKENCSLNLKINFYKIPHKVKLQFSRLHTSLRDCQTLAKQLSKLTSARFIAASDKCTTLSHGCIRRLRGNKSLLSSCKYLFFRNR